MNVQANDFELFALEQQFKQERSAIDARWKALQAQAHPDKFASQGAAAQRLAMQWSVRINEAYQRLKDPLKRAAYLCELAGVPVLAHSNTAMPAEFLQQQMQWYEALEDAESEAESAPGEVAVLQTLLEQVQATRQQLLAQCEVALDTQHDYAAARGSIRALMFIEKFAADVHQRIDILADAQ